MVILMVRVMAQTYRNQSLIATWLSLTVDIEMHNVHWSSRHALKLHLVFL